MACNTIISRLIGSSSAAELLREHFYAHSSQAYSISLPSPVFDASLADPIQTIAISYKLLTAIKSKQEEIRQVSFEAKS